MAGDLFSYLNNRFTNSADPGAVAKGPAETLLGKIEGFRNELNGGPR